MSYSELRRLPTTYRRWYLKRLIKHFEETSTDKKENNTESISENIKKIDEFMDRLK
tara:strand:+ start:422 stop:589 length:168 start_codon:yes stop_codon:yes gene_type:complete